MAKKKTTDLEAPGSLPLARAVTEYWDVLFPDEPEAAIAIPRWIVRLLTGVEPGPAAPGIAPLSGDGAARLEVTLVGLKVELVVSSATSEPKSVGAIGVGSAPLFRTSLGPRYEPHWNERNPVDSLLQAPSKVGNVAAAFAAFELASALVGGRIVKVLGEKLRDGDLVLSGAAANDPFAAPREISAGRLDELTLDIAANIARSARLGQLLLSNVGVRRLVTAGSVAGNSQSLAAADDILVDKMHELLKSGATPSALQAARTLSHMTKGVGSADSKEERLRRRYSRKYGKFPKT